METDIVQLISQTGFPIAVAVFLLYKGYTQDVEFLKVLQALTAEIKELRKEHDEMHMRS